MPKTAQLHLIDLPATVDRLGKTKARIADLKHFENADKEILVAAASQAEENPAVFEGELFRAVVSFPDGRETTDWEALARHLAATLKADVAPLIPQFTTVSPVGATVRVVARKTS